MDTKNEIMELCAGMSDDEKGFVVELLGSFNGGDVARLRRKAERQGLVLKKGRDAMGCVGFMIADAYTNTLVAGYLPEYSMSYCDVYEYLYEGERRNDNKHYGIL